MHSYKDDHISLNSAGFPESLKNMAVFPGMRIEKWRAQMLLQSWCCPWQSFSVYYYSSWWLLVVCCLYWLFKNMLASQNFYCKIGSHINWLNHYLNKSLISKRILLMCIQCHIRFLCHETKVKNNEEWGLTVISLFRSRFWFWVSCN